MNIKLLIVLVLALASVSGCSKEKEQDIQGYSCDKEQNKLVEDQFNVCNKSSYLSSYCYKVAVFAHCKAPNQGESQP